MATSFQQQTIRELTLSNRRVHYFSLEALFGFGFAAIAGLPVTIRILLENLLRHCDGVRVTPAHVEKLVDWRRSQRGSQEIAFQPVRVLMQDFTGVPAIVDLAAMRDAMAAAGKDPALINPLNPVDLVIDHSVTVDSYAVASAYRNNVQLEMARNRERYQFLRWGQQAFDNFRVVPPGTGICHQVNLEYLAKSVWTGEIDGRCFAYPDTLVGTDSHTTMINGMAVLGWGVGGIEAEATMLGQPISMNIPEVVGFKLDGNLTEGITATDLVLTIAEMLRQHGVVGKFVEFYGPGLNNLSLADRATIANMSPEYGATCSFFCVDHKTLEYLELTGRDAETIELVEAYSKAQGLWRRDDDAIEYSSSLALDLNQVVPCLAGPRRPQDRVPLAALARSFSEQLSLQGKKTAAVAGENYQLADGAMVIAAITSCTNTSNPAVMMAAGLLAEKALAKGLQRKPWVKTSLAPGSKVVTDYLTRAGLQSALDQLGFNLVGYGCTTCIGNSGPLSEAIDSAIEANRLTVCAVLSGNRNFEGRIHPRVKANWLASPPLVVAFALAGTVNIDLTTEPVAVNQQGEPVYLQDIWPDSEEIDEAVGLVQRQMFASRYSEVFAGDAEWNRLPVAQGATYDWDSESTYIRNPPFFDPAITTSSGDIAGARILGIFGDSVTTDHISPAGSIAENSPAGRYLLAHGVAKTAFNSYGSRRGNHEVMIRGTFANIRIRNEMLDDVEGGYTPHAGSAEIVSIYDAAMYYQQQGTALIVIAGKEYGTGSSRDWAAKGTRLLGIRAVIAESFERIHRSNLAGMGVLPLQFPAGTSRHTLALTGDETVNLTGLENLTAGMAVHMDIQYPDGRCQQCELLCRLDTGLEVDYFRSGGIMPYVVNQLVKQ